MFENHTLNLLDEKKRKAMARMPMKRPVTLRPKRFSAQEIIILPQRPPSPPPKMFSIEARRLA